jgi:hypothetical protein
MEPQNAELHTMASGVKLAACTARIAASTEN